MIDQRAIEQPITRKTLLRVILAIKFMASGELWIARLFLPRKWKLHYSSPMLLLITKAVVKVLYNRIRVEGFDKYFPGGNKIGDTLQIRRPRRYQSIDAPMPASYVKV